jgi:hypothetical protein
MPRIEEAKFDLASEILQVRYRRVSATLAPAPAHSRTSRVGWSTGYLALGAWCRAWGLGPPSGVGAILGLRTYGLVWHTGAMAVPQRAMSNARGYASSNRLGA